MSARVRSPGDAVEMVVEAHETEDRPWVTALFFVGFLAVLLLA